MARGWESKGVSDQIEEGKEQRPAARSNSSEVSPESRMRRQQLESLKLSRSRTMEQLQKASNPAYQEVLHRALSALEEQIEDISRQLDAGSSR
jgi:TATA-binding protein-associated factor Taf7